MNQATARKIQRIQSYNAEDTSTIILESRKQIQEIVVLANKYKFFAMDCEWVPQPNHKKIALIQLSFPNGKCFLLRAHKVGREILELLQDKGKSPGVPFHRITSQYRECVSTGAAGACTHRSLQGLS